MKSLLHNALMHQIFHAVLCLRSGGYKIYKLHFCRACICDINWKAMLQEKDITHHKLNIFCGVSYHIYSHSASHQLYRRTVGLYYTNWTMGFRLYYVCMICNQLKIWLLRSVECYKRLEKVIFQIILINRSMLLLCMKRT